MKGCNKLKSVSLINLRDAIYGLPVNLSGFKALTATIDFTKCNLDPEALFQLKTFSNCRLWLSGEEVPSYFTHRTTATSSLSIPLLASSLLQPFLRFRACVLFSCDNMSGKNAMLRFTGSFWNCSDSYDQAQNFCSQTKDYKIPSIKKDSSLFILDCQMSQIPLVMNFDHLDIEIHFNDSSDNRIEIKEWGIRIIEDEYEMTERSSKRMRFH
ncbi:hypothetical protein HA466_0246600 [Hirschfeldia incana]|nr:hypothetical protein HA466_0246600 [Hirschfeldia incana]KAJ0237738.1 hypothetical protein HA466_0246600 [Hirschfeldia incana]